MPARFINFRGEFANVYRNPYLHPPSQNDHSVCCVFLTFLPTVTRGLILATQTQTSRFQGFPWKKDQTVFPTG